MIRWCRGATVGAVLALAPVLASCTIVVAPPAQPPPPPPRTYTVFIGGTGLKADWRMTIDGAVTAVGSVPGPASNPAKIPFQIRPGQRAEFSVEINPSGYASCAVTRDDGVEIVELTNQDISLPSTGITPPAVCRFVG